MTMADQPVDLRSIAAEVPAHLPARLRVLCFVHLAAIRMRYCPFLSEVSEHLSRAQSTVTGHVAALADDGLLAHPAGSRRVAITEPGRSQARIVLDADRISANLTE